MTFAAFATDFRQLLSDIESFGDDHSPCAIWRRAYRASLTNAERSRRWKARAISLNPDPLHNAIALSGMAPVMWEERWHLGVAVPQPHPDEPYPANIEDVVLIDPRTGTATVMGDIGRTHVAPRAEQDRISVTTDAKAWARDIALARLEWYQLRRQRRHALQAEPGFTGDVPSALLLAPPNKVRWSDLRAKIIDVPADMRRDVNRAVFAQAQLPKIEGRA